MNSLNFWRKSGIHVLCLAVLISIILWWALPGICQGSENFNLIRHFDNDEAYIVNWAAGLYQDFIIPWDHYSAYPFFFYDTAGLLLFPYTHLKGIDPSVIVLVFRFLNLLVFMLTAALIYYIGLKIFKSWLSGMLAGLLFILTPGNISWVINSRPHLLANLLVLAGLYCCVRMTEQYDAKYLWGGVIFASMAFATDFTGIFLLPIVWGVNLAHQYGHHKNEIMRTVKSRKTAMLATSFIMALFGIAISISGNYITKAYRLPTGKLIAEYPDVAMQVTRMVIALGGLLMCIGALWWWSTTYIMRKEPLSTREKRPKDHQYSIALIINSGVSSGAWMLLVFAAIFLILNPSVTLRPVDYAAQFAYMLLGSSMGWVGATTFISPNRLSWIPIITDPSLLGISGVLLFIGYILWEALSFKTNWKQDRQVTMDRLVALSYTLLYLGIFFILVSMRKHHYLLSVLPMIFLLIAASLVKIFDSKIKKEYKWALIFIALALVCFNFHERFGDWHRGRTYFIKRQEDSSIYIGKWLKGNFDYRTAIWKDSNTFYIPPEFERVGYMGWNENIETKLGEIDRFDLLVITSSFDPKMSNKKKIDRAIREEKLQGFSQINKFDHKGPWDHTDYKIYKTIFIYARNGKHGT